jgi:prepilin-type N-terminal cleavage/methylation domain-containing protein
MMGVRTKMRKQAKVAPGNFCHPKKSGESGMTMIEVLAAMVVITIGMLGSMILILTGMQTNSRNRNDTTGTVLDQEIIEEFATLKVYPKGTYVTVWDCATGGGNAHEAAVTQGAGPAGAGATLDSQGNIDWTQAAPTLATSTTAGYAMHYQTCGGDIYEVRWNVMELSTSTNNLVSLLTVSSRQISAQAAQTAGAANQAILYARPTTLRTLIEK